MIQLSTPQLEGLELAKRWFKSSDEVFRIFGYAGTGKTTIIKELVANLGVDPLFGAYTGKAASVMRRMGNDASTLHSLTYKPVFPDKLKIAAIKKKIEENPSKELIDALHAANKIYFILNANSPLNEAELLVLDECSMVDDKLADDIKSFGCPIIVLGDPGQLPPIEGRGAFVRGDPDVLLTEIHRQARGNPIIDLSFLARTGATIKYQDYGESYKRHAKRVPLNDIIGANQILTGKNDSRRKINQQVRRELGFSGDYPEPGEKLICLRNSPLDGIYNGTLCEVLEIGDDLGNRIMAKIKTDEDQEVDLDIHKGHFEEYRHPGWVQEAGWHEMQKAREFDWGYAITVHKAQGSQWDNVVLYDDGFLNWNWDERKKWLYTGITRAVKAIRIIT